LRISIVTPLIVPPVPAVSPVTRVTGIVIAVRIVYRWWSSGRPWVRVFVYGSGPFDLGEGITEKKESYNHENGRR